jgi:hypothetical protein
MEEKKGFVLDFSEEWQMLASQAFLLYFAMCASLPNWYTLL